MAIRITNTRETNLGAKSNIYGRPLKYNLSKSGQLHIEWQWLQEDPATLEDPTVLTRVIMFDRDGVASRYIFQLTEAEVNTGDIPAITYAKVIAELQNGGNTLEEDTSGSWVAIA